jgi:hypothetical protein
MSTNSVRSPAFESNGKAAEDSHIKELVEKLTREYFNPEQPPGREPPNPVSFGYWSSLRPYIFNAAEREYQIMLTEEEVYKYGKRIQWELLPEPTGPTEEDLLAMGETREEHEEWAKTHMIVLEGPFDPKPPPPDPPPLPPEEAQKLVAVVTRRFIEQFWSWGEFDVFDRPYLHEELHSKAWLDFNVHPLSLSLETVAQYSRPIIDAYQQKLAKWLMSEYLEFRSPPEWKPPAPLPPKFLDDMLEWVVNTACKRYNVGFDSVWTPGEMERFAEPLVADFVKARTPKAETAATEADPPKESAPQKRITDRVLKDTTLFHDARGIAYASTRMQGKSGLRQKTWAVDSAEFKDRINFLAQNELKVPPYPQIVENVVNGLRSKAKYEGPEHEVALRLAGYPIKKPNHIYLDLADSEGRVVEINSNRWKIITMPPVDFVRPSGMLPLPVPVPGGKLDELRDLINIGDELNWKLVVGWLLDCLRPWGAHSVLIVHGPQGFAKSTTSKALRSLIDPNVLLVRRLPKTEEDLVLAASRNWIITGDNLSKLSEEMSDALCRLATGSGVGQRKFYGQTEEILFEGSRPILLNGITIANADRSDLRSRSVLVEAPPIRRYNLSDDLAEKLKEAQPRILGALLDAVVVGLRDRDRLDLGNLPRMADTVHWVEACSPGLGWQRGEFIDAFEEMQTDSDIEIGGDWFVLEVLERLLRKNKGGWEGTMGALLDELDTIRTCAYRLQDWKPKPWPTSPTKLSAEIRRHHQTLRRVGIQVTKIEPRKDDGWHYSIRRGTEPGPDPVE